MFSNLKYTPIEDFIEIDALEQEQKENVKSGVCEYMSFVCKPKESKHQIDNAGKISILLE